MKKEDLLSLGLTEETATKVLTAWEEEVKNFIPKTRFDEVNELKKRLESDMKDRDKQLDDLKKAAGSADELKKQIEALQAENKAKDEQHQKEIFDMKVSSAVESALISYGAHSTKAVKPFLDLEKAEFDKDGAIKGLKEQIETLAKDEKTAFLFKTKGQEFKGMTLHDSEGSTKPTGGVIDVAKVGYAEAMKMLSENPDAKIV